MGAIDLVVQIEAPPSVASGTPAHRPRRPPRERGQRRRHLPEIPRRSGRLGGGRARDARRRRRSHPLPAQPARHRRAAGRGDGVDGRVGRRRALRRRCGARRRSPSSAGRRSTACSTCSPGAIRPTNSPSCARASRGTGVEGRVAAREGAKRVAVANGGTIPDRGLYGVFLVGAATGRRARRRARRGDGVRKPRRRDLRARRVVLAHRRNHARPRARVAGARTARQACRSGKATARGGRWSSDSRSAV